MILEEVTAEAYHEVIPKPWHCFADARFNNLNARKVEKVHYLLFKDSKLRLGLVAGQREGILASPFSAPYGGYTPIHTEIKIQSIEEAVDCTEQWAVTNGVKEIRLSPPPPIYNQRFHAKVSNVLHRKNFSIAKMELNFHFDLSVFTQDYGESIWENARKNLNKSFDSNLSFRPCISESEKEEAYNVVRQNRNAKEKPLRMTWQEVAATAKIIPVDFFMVSTPDKQDVAAAIIFNVAPEIALVVYWGDIPDFSHLKVMNFLSFKVFEYYKQKNFRFIDIGISTVDSIPNYGLIDFKESLGCDMQPKVTFVKRIVHD